MSAAATIADPIVPRDIDFELDPARAADWCGTPARTTFLNALSIMFPPGERFFISSVAAFRDRVAGDPALREAVRGFTAQEALHTREHIAYNALLDGMGAAALEQAVADHLNWVKKTFGPMEHLAATCALEHFTAIMAHEALGDPAYFEGADATYRRLWIWHALEETEHKAVAYDVFQKVAGRGAYFLRVRAMVFATITFVRFVSRNLAGLYAAQGLGRSPVAWAKLLWNIFGYPGLVRRIALPYLRYYAPGFHPNDIDDHGLVARAQAETAAWA